MRHTGITAPRFSVKMMSCSESVHTDVNVRGDADVTDARWHRVTVVSDFCGCIGLDASHVAERIVSVHSCRHGMKWNNSTFRQTKAPGRFAGYVVTRPAVCVLFLLFH